MNRIIREMFDGELFPYETILSKEDNELVKAEKKLSEKAAQKCGEEIWSDYADIQNKLRHDTALCGFRYGVNVGIRLVTGIEDQDGRRVYNNSFAKGTMLPMDELCEMLSGDMDELARAGYTKALKIRIMEKSAHELDELFRDCESMRVKKLLIPELIKRGRKVAYEKGEYVVSED